MIFVGAQSINSRAILANEKIYTHYFLWGAPGGTDNLWGHVPSQPPSPVATPLICTPEFL